MLGGQDVQALGQILSASGSASVFLGGPVVVEISGEL
jgi:hypothetical protein